MIPALTWRERRILCLLLLPYLRHAKVRQMKQYIQHGSVSTLSHSKNVAEVSCWLNSRLRIGGDPEVLAVGALLHDFYLYDWHTDENHEHPLHGISHPEAARQNARRYFHVTPREQEVIRCHMWPLTLTHVPTSREATLVCIADKYCSLYETLLLRKQGGKRR